MHIKFSTTQRKEIYMINMVQKECKMEDQVEEVLMIYFPFSQEEEVKETQGLKKPNQN